MTKTSDELLAETRDSAVAVLEDYDHLTEVVGASETNAVDLRYASAIMRRWLVEGALQRVANPRIGRVQILAIDNNPIYKACRSGNVSSFVSGGASVHGIYLAAGMINVGNRAIELEEYHPDKHILLQLESFLRQRVIYVDDTWITRGHVIKFIANNDRGVHDGKINKDKKYELLEGFRQQVTVELTDVKTLNDLPKDFPSDQAHIPTVFWSIGQPATDISLGNYSPQRINGLLLELLASMHFLVASPDVKRLRDAIEGEL